MRMSKLLLTAAMLAGLATTSTGANAQAIGANAQGTSANAQGDGYGQDRNSQGNSRITGRTPNYTTGLGLEKQTQTGGPSGGSPFGGK